MFNPRGLKLSEMKNETLAGFVVAVSMIPEAVGFSLVAGLSPIVGLHTAFIIGLVTALFGGKPGMVSGAAGSIVVVLMSLAAQHGMGYVLWATIFAGVIQILIGVFRLGKFIRLVPLPAVHGFVNGLAIVIMLAQLHMIAGQGLLMYGLVLLAILVVVLFPKLTKIIPSSLAALIVVSAVAIGFNLHTLRVGDLADISGALPHFSLPVAPFNVEMLKVVLPYAVVIALVGLIESLLTMTVLDEMGHQKGNGNRESIAQGAGNTICGLFGCFAGCAMIGQSIINFTSGGRGRISGTVGAILLILFVVSLSGYIGLLPVAALAGIMLVVCYNTFEWSSLRRLRRMPKADVLVMLIVTVITIFTDLAVAVISGVIISALVFAWQQARIRVREHKTKGDLAVYKLDGPLFFGSAATFAELFNPENDPQNVVLDFAGTRVMDSSGVEAIDKLTTRYLDAGKTIRLRHLSNDCVSLLKKAGPFCSHELDDPQYYVAEDNL
ncbi:MULTISPECIES: SulP family inorganic anion transporter [Rahnella]|jgi:SulP family sulfate permease|uniref:Sulphate transporter n=1 Tax=Rahnella sp. (strain Y9602) TaxID=2703885 RepID=A0A0H3FG22_RAHSY|nr:MULTISPECIES: SulP family inorganic anion transporter [Rahnella]ADW73897.1 sulphate transporter [Rahnella aceris]AFE58544.1 sulfate transporter [Rahnella aquatilis HX2]MBU9860395.1 SulP family inorganic anion transporter [Rahnella aceris]MDP9705605.1 SulP family sulfate permease [Rahnella aquatilis]